MGYYDGRGARRVHQLQVDGPIVWQAECSFEPASLLVDSLVDYATWAVSTYRSHGRYTPIEKIMYYQVRRK